jgi:hypothetical protein
VKFNDWSQSAQNAFRRVTANSPISDFARKKLGPLANLSERVAEHNKVCMRRFCFETSLPLFVVARSVVCGRLRRLYRSFWIAWGSPGANAIRHSGDAKNRRYRKNGASFHGHERCSVGLLPIASPICLSSLRFMVLAPRTNHTPKADMTRRRIDRLRVPCGRPIAPAIVWRAQM